MKKVEIMKTVGECRTCMDTAETYDSMPPCDTCKNITAELIDIATNFWGTYAIVKLESGRLDKVLINRIVVED